MRSSNSTLTTSYVLPKPPEAMNLTTRYLPICNVVPTGRTDAGASYRCDISPYYIYVRRTPKGLCCLLFTRNTGRISFRSKASLLPLVYPLYQKAWVPSCRSSHSLRLWHRPDCQERATPKPTHICIYTKLYRSVSP